MRTALRRAVAAGAVGLAGVTGVALAATAVVPATAATPTAEDTAGQADDDALRARVVERIRAALDTLVEAGTVDDAQADAVAETLADDMGPGGRGHGFGPGHGFGHGGPGAGISTAAEALGLTVDELRDALADGTTLADVAATQGVPTEDLVAALVAAAEERIDEAVADGRLDAAEAAERTADLAERVTDHVENGMPVGGHHGGGMRSGGGMGPGGGVGGGGGGTGGGGGMGGGGWRGGA
jgi:polyhydroxyalkanoate synthesis regulator phasin